MVTFKAFDAFCDHVCGVCAFFAFFVFPFISVTVPKPPLNVCFNLAWPLMAFTSVVAKPKVPAFIPNVK